MVAAIQIRPDKINKQPINKGGLEPALSCQAPANAGTKIKVKVVGNNATPTVAGENRKLICSHKAKNTTRVKQIEQQQNKISGKEFFNNK